jgi:hypothetical protein
VLSIQGFHAFWILAAPSGGGVLPWFANLLIDLSQGAAAALVFAVALRYRGSRLGLAWSLLGLGLLFGLFAETSWSFQELALHREVPLPSISDIGYVGAYFPVFLGLLLMPQAPAAGLSRLKLAADALIVMSSLALLSWFLIVESTINQAGESVLARALSIFYPFADLGIIFAAFVLVARAGGSRFGLAFGLLASGYFATAFSDSLYAYVAGSGYETGNYIDIGWVTANSLISLAALAALGRAAALEPHTSAASAVPSFWRSLLPYAAVGPLAALFVLDAGDGSSFGLAAGFLAVLTLIIARQVLAIYENVQLNRELAELAASLEYRVKEKTIQLLRQGRPGGEGPAATGQRPNGADERMGGLRRMR